MTTTYAGPKRRDEHASSPWDRWSGRRSDRAARFMGRVVVPHGHGAGGRLRVARFQRQLLADLLDGAPPARAAGVSIPAGNGKTTFCAALGLFALCADGELGAQVLVVSRKLELAMHCWNTAVRMVDTTPDLASRLIVFRSERDRRIVDPVTGSEFRPIPARGPEDLQGWNPSLAIIDEFGFVERHVWDNLIVRGAKRARPLVLGIGTPGYDLGLMWELRQLARTGQLPRGFTWVEHAAPDGCELDDRRAWKQANPAIREGFASPAALEMSLATSPAEVFRAMHLGQWAGAPDQFITAAAWDRLPVAVPPGAGARITLGFDGSDTTDWTALVACTTGTPRQVWVVGAWNPAHHDGRIPRREVLATIDDMFRRHDVLTLAMDPFGWQSELNELERRYAGRVRRWPATSRAWVVRGADRLRSAVVAGDLVHDGSPVLAAHLHNMRTELTVEGPVVGKKSADRPTDVAFAAMIAHDVACQAPAPPAAAPRPRIY